MSDLLLEDQDAWSLANDLSNIATHLGGDAVVKSSQADAHWLCLTLADMADAVDQEVVLDAFIGRVEDELRAQGVDSFVVDIMVGPGLRKVLAMHVNGLMPWAQLAMALRVIAILVCPDVEKCPAGDRLGDPVFEAILDSAPGV